MKVDADREISVPKILVNILINKIALFEQIWFEQPDCAHFWCQGQPSAYFPDAAMGHIEASWFDNEH